MPNLYEKERNRLLRWWALWQVVLPFVVLGLSLLSMENFEQRVALSSLFVAGGFFAVAAGVGPGVGLIAAVIIFFGALLGAIAFSWTIALVVALIGIVRLRRLRTRMACGNDTTHPDE